MKQLLQGIVIIILLVVGFFTVVYVQKQLLVRGRASVPELEENRIDITQAPYAASPDGSTDNYAIVQRALTDIATKGGGTIYFPPGTYRISVPAGKNALSIMSRTMLLGSPGKKSTIKFDISSTTLHTPLKFSGQTSLELKDIVIEGTKNNIAWNSPAYWALVKIENSKNVKIINTKISNAQRIGLEILSSENISISSSEFFANGWEEEYPKGQPQQMIGGLNISLSTNGVRNKNITIENSTFTQNGGFGAWVGYADNISITGNTFYKNGLYPAHGNQDGVGLFGIQQGIIRKNQSTDNYADGIVIATKENDTKNVSVTSDVKIDQNTSARNGGNGIILYSTKQSSAEIKNSTISNNTVYDNGFGNTVGYPNSFDGIRLSPWGTSGVIHDITISRNTSYDTRTDKKRTQQAGIGQLPKERDPDGGLGANITLSENRCYNNAYADILLWERQSEQRTTQ